MPHPTDPTVEDAAPVTPPRRVTGRRLLVNTGALASANLWRIAASAVLQIWIARQLGVEALGIYTIALAYLHVCQVASELGLPMLLVRDLAQAPGRWQGAMRKALGFQLAASILAWGALVLWAALFPFSTTMVTSLWLIGASLPFYAITSVTQTLFQAGERMELVMGVEMGVNTLILVASGVMLWLGGGVLALVGVLVATQLVSALAGLWVLWRSALLAAPQRPAGRILEIESKPETATDTSYFLPVFPGAGSFFGLSLVDVLLQRADILLLSTIAGETVTGVYSAAYALVRVLIKLIQSGWRAIYPTWSRLRSEDAGRYVWLAATGLRYGLVGVWLAVVLGVGTAGLVMKVLFARSDPLFVWTYQILLWSTPLLLCETYANTLLLVEQRARQSLAAALLHLAAWALLLPWMTLQWQAAGAAWATVLSAGVGAGVALYFLASAPVAPRARQLAWPSMLGALAALLASNAPWPVGARLLLALGGYGGAVWYCGLVTAGDLQGVWRALFGRRL